MAYNLGIRFAPSPKPFTLLDPGAYQNDESFRTKTSKAPFLSKCPRNTMAGARIWTHAIYDASYPPSIPNCSAMMSKRPRFPYEALSKEDIDDILCKCGIQNVCECASEEEEEINIPCQARTPRRLFKGPAPKSHLMEQPARKRREDHSPPFYDAEVHESTAFYHGCKWCRWTSSRAQTFKEDRPGPADYTIERQATQEQICAEKFRSHRRQTSKQLRFIEMIQERDRKEGRPGPATYSPELPKSTDLEYLGPKADRFADSSEQKPGPADHWLKREFDPPEPPLIPCHATLPEPSFFGVKALRFKPWKEVGPSPATYDPNDKLCNIVHCPTAPFNSSTKRFKETIIEEDDDFVIVAADEPESVETSVIDKKCPDPTWEFKSKTIRMKPLEKKQNEPSPADLPQSRIKVERLPQLQYIAPFYTSEGRFQPWNDWMPIFGKLKTPGPCTYSLEKPKCNPAVCRGPLFRSKRFPTSTFQTPAPNEYEVGGGLETVLATHNQKLRTNIENQHKFHWEPPVEPRKLSLEEQETLLLKKSIQLLETDDLSEEKKKSEGDGDVMAERQKPKLLKSFLYSRQTPVC